MVLYENGKVIAKPKTLKDAKRIIAGMDLAMATVDADYQEYAVFNSRGQQVYSRPRIHVP